MSIYVLFFCAYLRNNNKKAATEKVGVTQMSLLQHQLKAMDEATKIVTNMEVGIGKRKHLCKRIALFKAGNILTD